MGTIGTRSFCFIYAGQSTWENGARICAMNNAELPLPLNAQEDADLYNYLKTNFNIKGAWLNAGNNNGKGVWYDSNGNEITYFNWNWDQPNGHKFGGQPFIHYNAAWNGKWGDHYSTLAEHIVCQKLPFGSTTQPPTTTKPAVGRKLNLI